MNLQTDISCTLCHAAAASLTYRGTPLCEAHWQQTLSTARRVFLAKGAERGYPLLFIRPWITLGSGETNWYKFATWGSDEAVQIALERLTV